ncbi:antitoxin [Luteipulveratus halotolerans]|uniref:Antitoxin n=1 Tax=Luteipulveratus halotolerans TaxID=1631356 RepID=A0A0L6CJL4_9MICO|nr:antitoxin [Luteipulveratus halotolerans]KNX37810.1 hypothetical protein VV01_12670 [Luteipulveratus halotolerans]
MAISDLVNKAKQWASKKPDKARQAIDKVEDVVDSKTGGKYRDKVDQAGDAVGGQLGIPKEGAPQGQAPQQGQQPQGQQAPQQPQGQQPQGGQAPQQGQQPPAAG